MFLIPEHCWSIQEIPRKGRGVFAAAEIPAGSLIGDYIGTVIKPEAYDEHGNGLYGLWHNDRAIIVVSDPQRVGVHLLNHSCAPNCTLYPHQGHTLIVALRAVFPGEELTISYLLDPPPEAFPCTHACVCGARVCHGTMHADHKTSQRWEAFVMDMQGPYFMAPPVAFGEELPPLETYPKILEDQPIYNIFASDAVAALESEAPALLSVPEIRKLMRESGRKIHFPKLQISVVALINGLLLCEPLS